MQFTVATITLALAALAVAAPAPIAGPEAVAEPAPIIEGRQVGTANIQFDSGSKKVTLGTRSDVNLNVATAKIASVKGSPKPSSHASCQAFKQSTKIGAPFTLAKTTTFDNGKKVQITAIECDA